MQRLYPIGIQNFEGLRNDGYVYVDKTALVYQLANTGKYYFLGRPRRFGKSLLLSTLDAYFSGKKELFKGLAIEKLEKDWTKHPILHFDLNAQKYDSPSDLEAILIDGMKYMENIYGGNPTEKSLSLRFKGLIRAAVEATGHRAVILVDEYDKPILQAIGNPGLQEEYKNTLKAFYGVMKSMDGDIRFGMLTGVTKFGKVSVFSDLNNLEDISMGNEYATICGITEKELHENFEEELHKFAEQEEVSYAALCEKVPGLL